MRKAIRADVITAAARMLMRLKTLAIERAKALFGCAYANVQPHSGSQANQAVYLARCCNQATPSLAWDWLPAAI
jgi:hypothetical protein